MPQPAVDGADAPGSGEERIMSRLGGLDASQQRIESALSQVSCALNNTTAALDSVTRDLSRVVDILGGQAGGEATPTHRPAGEPGARTHAHALEASGGSFIGLEPASEPDARAHTPAREPSGGMLVSREASAKSSRKREAAADSSEVEAASMGWSPSMDGDIAWALPAGWPSSIAMRDNFQSCSRSPSHGVHSRALKVSASMQSPVSLWGDEKEQVAARGRRVRCPRFAALSPGCNVRIAFGLCGVVVLLFDSCAVPFLLAWDIPFVGPLRMVALGIACFWTLDLLLSFVTGYYHYGALVTDLYMAARHYVRTWLVPDLCVLACDWMGLVLVALDSPEDSSVRGLRMLRFTKAGRLLRIAGLLRMVKFAVVVEDQMEKHLSDTHYFLLKIVAIFCGILWVNHLVACAFYVIGISAPSNTGAHWVDSVVVVGDSSTVLLDEGVLYQYLTSLHWSIAQITLGSMEVHVSNTIERAFNIGVLLLGLVFYCTLVSSLSGTMVEFHMMHKERHDTFRTLRIYLRKNRVDRDLAQQVQMQATERFGRKVHLSTRTVPALNLISGSLRAELHFHICQPYMVQLPLMRFWASQDASMCRHFCIECVTFLFPMPRDDVFLAGTAAESCYHVIAGSLTYVKEPGSARVLRRSTAPVCEGRWLCEAALWAQWVHVGRLEAETECQLLVVHAQDLDQALQRNRILRDITMEYAAQFYQRIQSAKPPTAPWPDDLGVPFTEFCDLVVSADAGTRTYIGLNALDQHASAASWGWYGGLAAGPGLDRLREEVLSGRSVVTVNGSGDAERIVLVVALQLIRRGDSHVFAQLAKQEGPGMAVVPCCQFPGRKQEYGDLALDTARSILHHLGLTEASVEIRDMRRIEPEWKESREYGVRTKYKRTVCHMELLEEFAPSGRVEVASVGFGKQRWPGRPTAEPPEPKLDVFIMRHDNGRTHFYAWLAPAEFELLQTPAGETRLFAPLSELNRCPTSRSTSKGSLSTRTSSLGMMRGFSSAGESWPDCTFKGPVQSI